MVPLFAIALLVFTGALGVAGAYVVFAGFVGELPSPQDLAKDPLAQSTKVFDRTGEKLLFQFEVERREIAKLEEIPEVIIEATIAAEDKSFWSNPGVDFGGIIRAVIADVTKSETGQGGASTITQQLVKQRIVGNENSLVRKAREAILAIEVTQTYSKKEILELYFNQIFYGNQAYGIKAAVSTYFGKDDLSKVTLAEAALLAGLPQSPSVLDPSREENLERAKARRAYVLDRMLDDGTATAQEAAAANAEAIKTIGRQTTAIIAPHFVFQVRSQLTQILGGDESAVTRGGFKVITTLDLTRQEMAERQVREWVESLQSRNVWNAALVSLNPTNGEVLTYVGSVDYTNREDPRVQGQFDVAGLGLRQPGSSFKMFNYVTALKKGATAATVVIDARTDFTGKATPGNWGRLNSDGTNPNCGYCPENADLQYHGPTTMRQAVRESRNVPAVRFLAQYSGIEDMIATAKDMGITTPIDPNEVGLSLTLGAQSVKLLDMTSAYGTLANMGTRVTPTFIQRVEDPRGRVVWEHRDFEQKKVLDPGIAWIMTDILKDTTNPARDLIFGSWTNIGRPAALKTGTTDNFRDVLAMGFVPEFVTGVWMGNSNNLEMSSRDFSSAMGPGQLWREYMKEALADVPPKDWERPSNVVSATVAIAPGAGGGYGSGLLPSGLTPYSSTEWFLRGTEPRRPDDWFTTACGGVVMRLNDNGFAQWQKYTDRWAAEANSGQHGYGRYSWRVAPPNGCAAGLSPAPSPSGSANPSTTLPPTQTMPPGVTFPGVTLPPPPVTTARPPVTPPPPGTPKPENTPKPP